MVAAVAVLAALLALRSSGEPAPDPDTRATIAARSIEARTEEPPTEPPPGLDEPDPGAVVPPGPAMIEVELSVTPARAEVRLDGEVVTWPVELPSDGAEHRLEISARGYQSEERTFTADRDQSLEVLLRRRPRSGQGGTKLPARLREW
jgi:hypothetical protein